MNPAELARKRIRDIRAYHVEPHPCPVILDANESPYPLPTKVMERLWVVMAGTELNRYPDMNAARLHGEIARKEGARESEILTGNGSDEIIQSLIMTLCEPGDSILAPSPTFTMYRHIANCLGVDMVDVPLEDGWTLDADKIIAAVRETAPKIVFLATPNNPTGTRFADETVRAVIDASEGVVVVDEAYVDFASAPYGLLYRDNPRVVILRTLSKMGLAALRLGYMMADERLIEEVNKTRLPYNVNSLSQAVAAEALANWDLFPKIFEAIVSERARVAEALRAMDGVTPFPSEANFILFRVSGVKPDKVFDSMLKDGVRVRWFSGAPRLDDCFRVTIGTPDENARFLAALESALDR